MRPRPDTYAMGLRTRGEWTALFKSASPYPKCSELVLGMLSAKGAKLARCRAAFAVLINGIAPRPFASKLALQPPTNLPAEAIGAD